MHIIVKQGCSVSIVVHYLGGGYDQKSLPRIEIGIRVRGKKVNMIRYADDKAVVASSLKVLQELMNRLNAVTKEYGVKINVNKTKIMCTSRQGTSKVLQLIDDQQVEQESQFKYSGKLDFR